MQSSCSVFIDNNDIPTKDFKTFQSQRENKRDENLVKFFSRVQAIGFEISRSGTVVEQAREIRAWVSDRAVMDNAGGRVEVLEKVEELDLSNASLTELPEEIKFFKNVEKIVLTNNQLTTLPAAIGELKLLNKLNISFNMLRRIPFIIDSLEKLSHLEMSNNQLEFIPAEIFKLPSLISLDLEGNLISSLNFEVPTQSSLRELHLGNNKLKAIPKSFEAFQNLELLYLNGNELKEYPEFLKNMSPRCCITAKNNRGFDLEAAIIKDREAKEDKYLIRLFTELGREIEIPDFGGSEEPIASNIRAWMNNKDNEEKLLNVKKLELIGPILPKEIKLLKDLEGLKLRYVDHLPGEIASLQKLKSLEIFTSKLQRFPLAFDVSKLDMFEIDAKPQNPLKLKSFKISIDNFSEIKPNILDMINLEELDVRGIEISSFFYDNHFLQKMRNLKSLSIGNHLNRQGTESWLSLFWYGLHCHSESLERLCIRGHGNTTYLIPESNDCNCIWSNEEVHYIAVAKEKPSFPQTYWKSLHLPHLTTLVLEDCFVHKLITQILDCPNMNRLEYDDRTETYNRTFLENLRKNKPHIKLVKIWY